MKKERRKNLLFFLFISSFFSSFIIMWLFLLKNWINIDIVYKNQNRFDEALIKYEEALRIYKETLPSNHPYITMVQNQVFLLKTNLD